MKVGFPAFNLLMQDQFEKQESDSSFILWTTPDILTRHVQIVCLSYHMSYFIRPVLQIFFIKCW